MYTLVGSVKCICKPPILLLHLRGVGIDAIRSTRPPSHRLSFLPVASYSLVGPRHHNKAIDPGLGNDGVLTLCNAPRRYEGPPSFINLSASFSFTLSPLVRRARSLTENYVHTGRVLVQGLGAKIHTRQSILEKTRCHMSTYQYMQKKEQNTRSSRLCQLLPAFAIRTYH